MNRGVLLILFLFGYVIGSSQPNLPENGPVYTSEEIPKVYIIIDQDSLDDLYLEENWYSNYEYGATFIFETETFSDTIPMIGFRFRGNTSRDKIKKSFKVSFNTYVPGRKYYGLEKMNLNAETNDPAMMRSRLCWDLYRNLGVPAPRSNHVEVYINGEYYGLYLNTEHIDEEFCENRFGSQGGNLYKCSYPANLDYLGPDPDAYKVAPWDSRTYELKTNTELDDYSDIAEFISFLNLSGSSDFTCQFYEYFNVYAYLKVAAIDVLTGNWDGYIYNQNNYYLYHNPTTSQFEYIPYDTDNTWGIDWINRNWSNRPIYNWSQTGATRPLFNRLMDSDEFRDVFSYHIQDLLNNHYFTEEHITYVENLQGFIEASALSDPYRPLDWGHSDEDFLNSLTEAAGGHVDFGVLEFAEIRKNSANNQLESFSIGPIALLVKEDFASFPDQLIVKVFSEGPELTQADFNYSIDGISQSGVTMSLTEFGSETTIEFDQPFDQITYNISLMASNGEVTDVYCSPKALYTQSPNGLVINEVMTSNNQTIADEAGEFEDWIELYNSGEVAVQLADYFLTDNSSSPTKWEFPNYILQPEEFLLVWADRDLADGPMHANFRLSAGGEEVHLFKEEVDGIRWIDGIDVPPIPSDYSFGRENDAELPWMLFWSPTPGYSNSGTLSVSDLDDQESSTLYPNPTDGLIFFREFIHYRIESLDGRILLNGSGNQIDLSSFSSGVYLVRSNLGVERVAKF